MIITGEVIAISTFKQNRITIRTVLGDIQCKMFDLHQWDEIYNYFNKPITVDIARITSDMTDSNTIWIVIVDGENSLKGKLERVLQEKNEDDCLELENTPMRDVINALKIIDPDATSYDTETYEGGFESLIIEHLDNGLTISYLVKDNTTRVFYDNLDDEKEDDEDEDILY